MKCTNEEPGRFEPSPFDPLTERSTLMCAKKTQPWKWLVAALLSFAPQVHALVITAVSAPNLSRPNDGKVYSFDILVSGTFDGSDLKLGIPNVTVEYWDEDFFVPHVLFDDKIDLTGLLAPPGPATAVGMPWGPVAVSLSVGCTQGSKVFGPAGGDTGENPMNDGYFKFYTGSSIASSPLGSWGYNTVQCIADSTGSNPSPPYPTLQSVPEPATLELIAVGLAGLSFSRHRKSN